MPKSKQRKRKGLAVDSRLYVTDKGMAELTERWETSRRSQITVINRLQGIIDFTREAVYSPSLTPDEKVQLIKEKLNA